MNTSTYILRRSLQQWARTVIDRIQPLLDSQKIPRTIGIQSCESLERIEKRLRDSEENLSQQDLSLIRSSLENYDATIKSYETAVKS